MDPFTIFAVASSVASGIGALSSNKKNERRMASANEYNKNHAGKLDLKLLRKEAEKNGFNALTVLRNTGGAGFQNGYAQATPYTSPLSVIGEVGQNIVGNVMNAQSHADNRAESAQRVATSKASEKMMVAEANRALTVPTQVASGPAAPNMMPLETSRFADVATADIPFWKVRSQLGDEYQIRADVLERLGLAEGSTITVEDWEAMLGDIGGEVEGIGTVIKGGIGAGTPFFKPVSIPAIPDVTTTTLGPPPPMVMRDPDPQAGWNSYLGF